MSEWAHSDVEFRNRLVYVIEVGYRAALRTESRPRDLRWFRTLW